MAKRQSKAVIPGRRTARGYRERPVRGRELRPRFLIVCEGTRTEPMYFESFRLNRDVVRVQVKGVGQRALAVVQEALRLRTEWEDYDASLDQVWCAFDRDDMTADDFNAALRLAEQNHIRVAYSNEAFELWYLLHFQYLDTATSRHDCCIKLNGLLNHPYIKTSPDMYDELKHLQPTAIANAKRLLAAYTAPDPANDNPSTTVHLLVEQLNRYVI